MTWTPEPVAQLHPNHWKPNPDGTEWCREVLLYSPNNEGDKLRGVNTRENLYTLDQLVQVRRKAILECAKLCEAEWEARWGTAKECADVIRKLGEDT